MNRPHVFCLAGLVSGILAFAEPMRIAGTVKNGAGEAQANVTVAIYRGESSVLSPVEPLAQTRTDAGGVFEFTDIDVPEAAPQVLYLVAGSPGDGIQTIALYGWMSRSHDPGALELVLHPLPPVGGRVLRPDGGAAPGADVRLLSARFQNAAGEWQHLSFPDGLPFPALRTKTDDAGRFVVPGPTGREEATVNVQVSAEGFAQLGHTLALEGDRTVTLERGGSISGRVTNETTGGPVAGVTVWCSGYLRDRRRSVSRRVTTGEGGRYVFRGLPPADGYRVDVRGGSLEGLVCAVRRSLVVQADEELADVDLVLTPGGLLEGVVRDETAQPVVGALVRAGGSGGSFSGRTDAEGRYRIRCPAGPYEVRCSSVPKGYVVQRYDESVRAQASRGKTTDVAAITLAIGRSIKGVVLDAAGAPAGKARVRVNVGDPQNRMVTTKPDGTFKLDGLPKGARLGLVARDAEGRNGLVAVFDPAKGKFPDSAELRMKPHATIRGKVASSRGEPVGQRRAHLQRGDADGVSLTESAETDEAGAFTVRVPAGTYRIGIGREYWRHQRGEVAVKSGETKVVPDITWDPPPTVAPKGVVVDAAGVAVPKARVSVRVAGYQELTQISDGEGRFQFEECEPERGSFYFSVKASDKRIGFGVVNAADAGAIRLTVGPSIAGEGRVVDTDGKPIAGARVRVYANTAPNTYSSVANAESASDGRFRVEGLAPGREIYLYVGAEGYGEISTPHVRPAAAEKLDFGEAELAKADSFVGGVVVDHLGKPVAGVTVRCRGPKSESKRAVTTAAGRFRMEGIPGRYPVDVSAFRSGPYQSDRRENVTPGREDLKLVLWPDELPEPEKTAEVGKAAPPLQDVDWIGTPVSAGDLKGAPAVLCFLNMHHRDGRAHAMVLAALAQSPRGEDLRVIALHDASATDDDLAQLRGLLGEGIALGRARPDATAPWLSATYAAYGVRSVPHVCITDGNGVLRYEGRLQDLSTAVGTVLE